jgi:hypothetical protein
VAHENTVSKVPAANAAADAAYHLVPALSLSRGDLMRAGVPF